MALRPTRPWVLAGLVLAALVSTPPRAAHAHEGPTPPRPVQTADGVWPDGIAPSTDVIVPIMVTVDAQGAIVDASVEVSLGPLLDAAALEAVRTWRFEPARQDGEPVAARVRAVVRFRAAEAPEPVRPAPAPAPPPIEPPRARPLPPPAEDAQFGATTHSVRPPPRSASEVVREGAVLTAAPHRTGADMLRLAPGLFVTQHSGEGKAYQIFYRGFDAVHGQDLEIWVGGAPVNDVSNIHGQGYADLNFVMPEVVRSLRVTPGTYDPRQGDFAVAGSARLELGYDEPGITAKGGYGSFGSYRAFLAYRPERAQEGTFAAAEVYGTDGFGPARAAQRGSAMAQGVFRVAEGTNLRVLASAYGTHFASAGVLRLDDITARRVSRFATYDPNQGGASTRVQLVAELAHASTRQSYALAPYVVLRTLRLAQNFTGYLVDVEGDGQEQLHDDVALGATARYRRVLTLLSAEDAVEAGMFVRSDRIEQSQRRLATADQSVTATEVDARLRALDVAAYLDVALHAFSRVALRGGLRVDSLAYAAEDRASGGAGRARTSQGVVVSPRATLEVRAAPGLSALMSYGHGFRSPQVRSLVEGQTTPFTRVRSGELGVRYASSELAATLSGFRSWLSEDLVFDQATARNETVPATARTGVTADVRYAPLAWVDLTVNATWSRAEFRASSADYRKGDLVPYAPQLVGRADLSASPTVGQLWGRPIRATVGSGVSYLTRRPLPYGAFGHHILLVDLQAGVRVGEVGVSARALNLFDAKWYDGEFSYASRWDADQAASLVPLRHVTVGAPRTLFVSLELHFGA